MPRHTALPSLGAVLLTASLLTLASCRDDKASTTNAAVPVEFGVDGIDAPVDLPTGMVTFTIRASDSVEEQQIQLLRVDDDTDPAALFDALGAGDVPRALELSRPAGGINLETEGSTQLIVELDTARYVFLDPDTGNVSDLLTASGERSANNSSIDGTVSMQEFIIGLPDNFGNGTYALEVTGDGVHGFTLIKLDDDVTLAQVQALIASDADLPGTEVVRAGNLGSGTQQLLTLDLPVGHYVAASYFPDFETDSTQAAQGMVTEFTVEG